MVLHICERQWQQTDQSFTHLKEWEWMKWNENVCIYANKYVMYIYPIQNNFDFDLCSVSMKKII